MAGCNATKVTLKHYSGPLSLGLSTFIFAALTAGTRGVRKSYSKRFLHLPAQNEVECDPPSQHHNYELNTSLVLRCSTALAPAGGLPTTPLKANRVSESRKIAAPGLH
jgi:hypothetical protein